ncbi:MAG: hypothetical protein M1839_000463 [Geoglossum umbratile]|nr:MAG: hypothetical protein M1839_000463 [Geoglossum umbratile]
MAGRRYSRLQRADTRQRSAPLTLAAEKGNVSMARQLLGYSDVDVNPKDKPGYTPLSLAADEGRGEAIQILPEREDVETNSEDKRGRIAMSWAARQGKEAIVRLLLERDDVEANDEDKKSDTARVGCFNPSPLHGKATNIGVMFSCNASQRPEASKGVLYIYIAKNASLSD